MREILFRGRTTITGEWIEGDLLSYPDRAQIWTTDTIDGRKRNYDVDPATVGQYTGLKDKSDRRIFEGDILRRMCPVYKLGQNAPVGERMVIGVVIWDHSSSVYVGYWTLKATDEYGNPTLYSLVNRLEVIGNIHDNPELLKGGGRDGAD